MCRKYSKSAGAHTCHSANLATTVACCYLSRLEEIEARRIAIAAHSPVYGGDAFVANAIDSVLAIIFLNGRILDRFPAIIARPKQCASA